jgi:hypothetical protein
MLFLDVLLVLGQETGDLEEILPVLVQQVGVRHFRVLGDLLDAVHPERSGDALLRTRKSNRSDRAL